MTAAAAAAGCRGGVGKSCEAAACKLRGASGLRRAAAAVVGAVRSVLRRGGVNCAARVPGKRRRRGAVVLGLDGGEHWQHRASGSADSLGRWGERRPRLRSQALAWRASGQPRRRCRQGREGTLRPENPGLAGRRVTPRGRAVGTWGRREGAAQPAALLLGAAGVPGHSFSPAPSL